MSSNYVKPYVPSFDLNKEAGISPTPTPSQGGPNPPAHTGGVDTSPSLVERTLSTIREMGRGFLPRPFAVPTPNQKVHDNTKGSSLQEIQTRARGIEEHS